MSFRHVGSDAEEHLGVLVLGNGVGAGARSERRGQTGDGRRMADAGAVVDIVGLKNSPEQLLHVVGIFINAARATDSGNGVRPMLGNDFLKLCGYQIQRLIPGGLAKLAVFLTNQRRGESVFRVNEIVGEAALHA